MRKPALLLAFTASIVCIGADVGAERGHRINSNSEPSVHKPSHSRSGHHHSSPESSFNLNLEDDLVADAAEMCYSDTECDDCYECGSLARCVPIVGCYLSCYSDADCARTQFCSDNHVCEEEPTPCYDHSECRAPQICDMDSYQCVDPTPSPTMTGCCAGSSEYAATRCQLASDESHCSRMSSCYWMSGEDADCEWKETQEPNDSGCCMITVT